MWQQNNSRSKSDLVFTQLNNSGRNNFNFLDDMSLLSNILSLGGVLLKVKKFKSPALFTSKFTISYFLPFPSMACITHTTLLESLKLPSL